MRSRAIVPGFVSPRTLVLAIVIARGVMACVEGVTPDCSNPSVCSPIEGDAGPLRETDAATDARADAATTDAPVFFDARTSDAADAADADGG